MARPMSKKRDVTRRLEADVARLQSEFTRVDTDLRTRIARLEKTADEVRALVHTATEASSVADDQLVVAPALHTPPTPTAVQRPMPAPVASPAKKAIANWPTISRTYLAPTASS